MRGEKVGGVRRAEDLLLLSGPDAWDGAIPRIRSSATILGARATPPPANSLSRRRLLPLSSPQLPSPLCSKRCLAAPLSDPPNGGRVRTDKRRHQRERQHRPRHCATACLLLVAGVLPKTIIVQNVSPFLMTNARSGGVEVGWWGVTMCVSVCVCACQ